MADDRTHRDLINDVGRICQFLDPVTGQPTRDLSGPVESKYYK